MSLNSKLKHTDVSLVEELRRGNKEAFRSLLEKYGNRLYQFSLKYLRNKEDAEDLLNEVFLKIWRKRHSIKSNTSFQAYLFTIAYNDIRKRFLQKSREEKYVQAFAEKYILESSVDEDRLDYGLFEKRINEIISLLPPRRKEIFNLSYKDELKNAEIADKLGLSVQFVKNQLSISRKFIADNIKESNEFAGVLLLFLFTGRVPD